MTTLTVIEPLDVELPVPPALNHYYRTYRNRVVISDEGRQYRQRVFVRVLPLLGRNGIGGRWVPRFAVGDVAVEVAWYRKAKQGDLDGRLKAVLDALNGLAYTDDKQIAHLTIFRHDKPYDGEPRLEVQVRAWP